MEDDIWKTLLSHGPPEQIRRERNDEASNKPRPVVLLNSEAASTYLGFHSLHEAHHCLHTLPLTSWPSC